MRKTITALLLTIGLMTATSAQAAVPEEITYCGFGDHDLGVIRPWKYWDGSDYKIKGEVRWKCSPYRLELGTIETQLQKMNRYGVMEDWGTPGKYECGYPGEGICPRDGIVTDWTYCTTDGYYRIKGKLYGYGPAGFETQTWGYYGPKYSVKTYIDC